MFKFFVYPKNKGFQTAYKQHISKIEQQKMIGKFANSLESKKSDKSLPESVSAKLELFDLVKSTRIYPRWLTE